MRRLYESLLDDEDDIINDETTVINGVLDVLNVDKQFAEYYFGLPYRAISGLNPKDHMLVDYDQYSKTVIFNKADIPTFHLERSIENLHKIIDLDFDKIVIRDPNLYKSNSLTYIQSEKINPTTYAKDITVYNSELYIDRLKELRDVNININTNGPAKLTLFPITYDVKLDNININMHSRAHTKTASLAGTTLHLHSFSKIPDLSGVKCNAESICYYDCSLFDDKEVQAGLEKIIDVTQPIEIFDYKLLTTTSKKMKIPKLVAAFNNPKRYKFPSEYCYLKSDINIKNILNLKLFPNLELIRFRNNNVEFAFTTNKDRLKHLSFFARRNVNDQSLLINNMPRTNDGWYLIIRKID